jgi:hypothetical protein
LRHNINSAGIIHCSQACQQSDWPQHTSECALLGKCHYTPVMLMLARLIHLEKGSPDQWALLQELAQGIAFPRLPLR